MTRISAPLTLGGTLTVDLLPGLVAMVGGAIAPGSSTPM
jgi:hypothetical protein